jgi:LytS/YehU family sensor histidine kinase
MVLAWVAYGAAWTLAAGIWTLAAAAGAGRPPLEALPYGLANMAIAGAMGVGVIHLAKRMPLGGPRLRFVAIHAAALTVYATIYGTWFAARDLLRGEPELAIQAVRSSPIVLWSLMMGSWLYLLVAGIAYAGRAHRTAVEARVLAQQAQLAALRAQVNPHFLFNALHSVASLVASDPRAADVALERLGDLLRYALSDDDLVPLASEWAFAGDYLEFEKLRLGDRLRTSAHADPETLRAMVPALLLQPIVENAVRHGIDPRPEGGRVELRARLEGDRLLVSVSDDGVGIRAGAGGGFGLRSVRSRLEARSGALLVASAAGQGCVVTVSLPAGRAAAA